MKARGDIIKQYGVNMVNHYEPGKYDFALLHFDQQCFEAEIMERGKGSLFKELNDKIQDIPKIIICHGTPYYPEKFPAKNEFGEDCDGISQELIDRARDACKGCYVIVNSKKAAEQWGFGTPIWHGMSPSEWFDLPKEPRVITMIGPAGLDKYYDRAFLRAIKESLAEEGVEHCHITVDWEAKDWEDYRQFLGRSLIYINPTKESPMPRSRTEAMLSGCCVLTTPHQDANLFIKDGVNGFMIERNPQKVVEKVKYLLENYEEAKRIGQAGKQTALELFNWERFRVDWLGFVENTIQDFKTKNQ
ncbi:MAG TPA: glycosyltransferase [Gammaproteobacteria bacterium]|nr:glycosyltransferase [Gammaproteobacteria bacterium]